MKKELRKRKNPIRIQWLEGSGPNSMKEDYSLELVHVIDKESQKVGNCSWANTKGGVYSTTMMMFLKDIKDKNPSISRKGGNRKSLYSS